VELVGDAAGLEAVGVLTDGLAAAARGDPAELHPAQRRALATARPTAPLPVLVTSPSLHALRCA
jgi:hypothetical protein